MALRAARYSARVAPAAEADGATPGDWPGTGPLVATVDLPAQAAPAIARTTTAAAAVSVRRLSVTGSLQSTPRRRCFVWSMVLAAPERTRSGARPGDSSVSQVAIRRSTS